MKGGMPVDCPLIFRRKHHGIEIKLKKESEENPLKKFKVTLTGHYQKTISVYAETPEHIGCYERYAATTALVRSAQKAGLDAPDVASKISIRSRTKGRSA